MKASRLTGSRPSNPGHLHVFDLSGEFKNPKLPKTIAPANGAYHVGFTESFKFGLFRFLILG